MSRRDLAARCGVSEKHISTVLNGTKDISPSFARKLGYVFQDAKYWLQLQSTYDEEQAKFKDENSITQDEINILKELKEILSYFDQAGHILIDCEDAEKILKLRTLLQISDLRDIPKVSYSAAYRAQLSSNIKINPFVLFAWQRLCEIETETLQINPTLNIKLLINRLNAIKSLMLLEYKSIIIELQTILADCGIAFKVVKNFRGAPVQGFIKKKGENIILCLTIRGKRADTFWFTLFHEIGHIIHKDYQNHFVDFDSVQNEIETRADQFASNFLIKPEIYKEYLRNTGKITWESIEHLAKQNGIQSFMVLGRLQKDKILDWSDFSNRIPQYTND